MAGRRRVQRRRSRRRGFKRSRSTRRSKKFKHVNSLSIPPVEQHLTLRVVNSSEIPYITIPNGASVGSIGFCCNDLWAFFRKSNSSNLAVSSTHVPNRLEWFEWYQRWRVDLCDMVVTISNTQSENFYFGIVIGNELRAGSQPPWSDTWSNTNIGMGTNRWTIKKRIGGQNSENGIQTIRMRFGIADRMGQGSEYRDDVNTWGGLANSDTPGTSPLNQLFGYILIWTQTGSLATADINLPIDIRVNLGFTAWRTQVEVT